MNQIWNSLLPVLLFIAAGAAVCFLVWNRNRGKLGSLKTDPLSNLFIDEEDRQDEPEEF